MRLADNLQHRLPICCRELGEFPAGVGAVQHLPHPPRQVIELRVGKRQEGRGVDQPTAAMLQQPGLQVEIAQAAALLVARAGAGEFRGELAGSPQRGRPGRFVGQQHGAQQGFAHAAQPAAGTVERLGRGSPQRLVDRHLIAEGQSRLVIRLGDQVVHVDLVGQHLQGHDVTVAGGKQRRAAERVERCLIARRRQVEPVGPLMKLGRADNQVPHVPLLAVRPGDVPASEAFAEGRSGGGDECSRRQDGLATGIGVDRAEDMARDPLGEGTVVALQAFVGLATEAGGVTRLLIERVKDRSLLGVDRRELEHRCPGNEADVDVIVEVNGTGRGGGDVVALQAGLGKDERLRLGRNAQGLEHTIQVPAPRLPFELRRRLVPRGLQSADGVVELLVRVVDGGKVVGEV